MSDIVERLRQIADTKTGEAIPECLRGGSPAFVLDTNWGVPLSAICGEAVLEIERLRADIVLLRSVAGAVSIDVVTFDQIKKDSRDVK